jgi:signal transduction histidine kinase
MQSITTRILLGTLWLALSISLGAWWTVMGLRQAENIAGLQKNLGTRQANEVTISLEKQQRMIKMEGSFFLALISIGGITLIYMSIRDTRRSQMIKDFFATLTHEIKTPLASLRLQAESLEEVLVSKKHKVLVKRLVGDSERLQFQLDNALYLASISRAEFLYLEKLQLNSLLEKLKETYPELQSEIDESIILKTDKRALECILRNLLENSIHRGNATEVKISTSRKNSSIKIHVKDNGNGFKGNFKQIGKLFFRHTSLSGNGIGLYLVKMLTKKLGGKVEFINAQNSFQVNLIFPLVEK